MKAILSPSLLSANLAAPVSEAASLQAASIAWLHLDIMDGVFVPNITYGPPFLRCLRPQTSLFFDAHLMISEPERYIADFAAAGADLIVPHIEAMRHPQRVLAAIRELGVKAGIALNPDTDPSRLRWLLPYLDMILIMGVNPGFSGQKFLPETTAKISWCREFLADQGHADMPIQVDGGAAPANAAALVAAGATILVSGSAFFRQKDYATARKLFADAIANVCLGGASERALLKASAWRRQNSQPD